MAFLAMTVEFHCCATLPFRVLRAKCEGYARDCASGQGVAACCNWPVGHDVARAGQGEQGLVACVMGCLALWMIDGYHCEHASRQT